MLSVTRRVFSILLFGLTVGVIGSMLSIALVEAIYFFEKQLFAAGVPGEFNIFWLLCPALGGLVVGLLLKNTEDRRAENVADVINAVQVGEKSFHWRDGVLNAIAAVVGMGSGASVGPYGALTTLGAHLGSFFQRWTRADMNMAVGCGIAAMISTAFSAPIAAVVFAHEVILRNYALRNFAPITIASSTGFFISAYWLGRPPLFMVEAHRSLFAPEFLAFVLIGLVGALVAILFMNLVIWSRQLAIAIPLPNWLKPAVAGLGIGLMAQWVPDVMGVGRQILEFEITGDQFAVGQMMVLLPAKMVATALCLGFGFAGGVFSPTLVIGVLTGALMGVGAEAIMADHSSGITFYAICGMVAVTSPVIGGPLTAILIVFELTRNYELTTAVMISVVFSNVLAYRLFGRSLFDRHLLEHGIDLSGGRQKAILKRRPIANHVTTEAVTVTETALLTDAKGAMLTEQKQECIVLDELTQFVGKLRLSDVLILESRLEQLDATCREHAEKNALTLYHDLSVWDAMAEMQDFSGESIPIIDRRGYYIGVIYHSTLVAAYLQTSATLRAEENAAI